MGVAIHDGLDHYPTDLTIAGCGFNAIWNTAGGTPYKQFVTGLNGLGKAMRLQADSVSTQDMLRTIPKTTQVSGIFRFKLESLPPNTAGCIFRLHNEDNVPVFAFRITPLGILQILNAAGAVLAATMAQVLYINTVYSLSYKLDITTINDNGFQCKLNGELLDELSLAGANIYNVPTKGLQVVAHPTNTFGGGDGAFQGRQTYIVDDMLILYDEYVLIPEGEIITTRVNADTADKDFTPLSGTDNFAMLDEIAVDEDTTYNSGDTIGDKDLFDFPNLGFTPESIECISLIVCTRKEESGSRSLKSIAKSGGVEYLGGEFFQSLSYTYDYRHDRKNPNGNVVWTQATADAYQGGYQITL